MALQRYQYEALPSASSFRLFSLFTGSDGDVKVKLESFSVDDPPDYDTISLDWACAGEKPTLVINDASASVPAAIFPALRAFRNSMTLSTNKFWADALCINQDDDKENSAQTRIRHDILQKASSVHIWIPEDDVKTQEATVKCIREGQGMLDSMLRYADGYSNKTELEVDYLNKSLIRAKHGRPGPMSYDWSPLLSLLGKPWFKRKLAIQELSWTKAAFLHYGTSLIPYDQLGKILVQHNRAERLHRIAGPTEEGIAMLSRAWLLYIYRIGQQSHKFDESERMFHYHALFKATSSSGFECADPRDHLYGVVTMMREYDAADEFLRPDYSLPWHEAFARFSI